MTSSVANAAAQGTGPPPKVLPKSPCAMVALTRSEQITAPIGSPEYQHRTDPVRGTAGGGKEFGRAVPRTGHALHRLKDQRRDCLIERCLEGLDVVEGNFPGQGHPGTTGA
jgi:hypothetical protein